MPNPAPTAQPAGAAPTVAIATTGRSPWPKVRHALILVLPPKTGAKAGVRVSVTENRDGGVVRIDDGADFGRHADLTVLELRFLAQFCNRIARRVANRSASRP